MVFCQGDRDSLREHGQCSLSSEWKVYTMYNAKRGVCCDTGMHRRPPGCSECSECRKVVAMIWILDAVRGKIVNKLEFIIDSSFEPSS